MTNLLFQELTGSILDEILSWNPSYATQLGWHKYDKDMMDHSSETYQREVSRLREFVSKMDEFDQTSLDADEQLDRDLSIYLFRVRIFEIERLRLHERMALVLEDIGNSLYFLFARDDQPFEARLESIASRLEKVPTSLETAKMALVTPCRLWNEVCLDTGKALPQFLEEIRLVAEAELGDHPLVAPVGAAVRSATVAILAFNRWLEEEVLPGAENQRVMSPQEFEEYLSLRSFGLSSREAVELATRFIDVARGQMSASACAIADSRTAIEAINVMRNDHPKTCEELLKAYREQIREARDFVVKNGLATVPSGEKLLVIETPLFMRHMTPYAAQCEPGIFTGSKTGLFLVTPTNRPEQLRDHCYPTIANTAVHEGYPGHHLQGICANTNSSRIRAICGVPEFCEGWALYCEDLMISHGFNDNPTGRMAQLNDLMFRIIRVVADVRLSTGEMTCEEFADMLVKEIGMEKELALLDAKTYTYSPTYYLSYFIGKLKILQLRRDLEEAMGDEFSLRFFHDTMLNAGSLPVDFMRRVFRERLMQDYGIDLGDPSETVYEFAMRLADEGRC